MKTFTSDEIEKIELEESRLNAEKLAENTQLQKNKLKYSHPYDKYFLRLFWDEVLKLIVANSYCKLVFLGAGAGNEAAYIRRRLPDGTKLVLTDLCRESLEHYKECFQNYGAPLPDEVLECSFNKLPFSEKYRDYCAIAFLCLHHSDSIERVVRHILDVFDRLILLEPMTNRLLKFLSRFGITQRAEDVEYRPARVNMDFFENLKKDYHVEIKTYVTTPRDYIPFISHRQHAIFNEEDMKFQAIWSKLCFRSQLFLSKFFSRFNLGNVALIHISNKSNDVKRVEK